MLQTIIQAEISELERSPQTHTRTFHAKTSDVHLAMEQLGKILANSPDDHQRTDMLGSCDNGQVTTITAIYDPRRVKGVAELTRTLAQHNQEANQ